MPATISIDEFAKRTGIARMTAHRWACAGKLGTVVMRPGTKVKGRRLVVAELVERGLLDPQTAFAEWSVIAADVLSVIAEQAFTIFKDHPQDYADFVHLWCAMFGKFPRRAAP